MTKFKLFPITNSLEKHTTLKAEIADFLSQKLKTNVFAHEITYKKDALGMPFFTYRTVTSRSIGITISISDTRDVWALSITDEGVIGLDIEYIRELSSEVLANFLTAKEKKWLKTQPVSYFKKNTVLLWTLKEAYLKTLGVGLRTHPQSIEIIPDEDGNFAISTQSNPFKGLLWYNVNTHKNLIISQVIKQ